MILAEIEERSTLALSASGTARATEWGVYTLIVAFGALLWWATRTHAAAMPVWTPWEFSWLWFLAAALALWWYWRGVLLAPQDERPSPWRRLAYVIGVLAIYTVLQTHFEYLAEHMFFLNRVQHVVMHHLGPFMIALAWPGAAIDRGMPQTVRRLVDARAVSRVMHVIQQPLLASVLFVGLVALWLVPPVHFRAMIDPKLYQVMNWSMVVDGVLFWILVLDPRPLPLARTSYGMRAAMAAGVILPQIVIGAVIAFAQHDLYAFYEWCGRIYPSIGALEDQQFGGLIIWIPPAMMSAVAFLLVINAYRLHEERELVANEDDESGFSAADWTGR